MRVLLLLLLVHCFINCAYGQDEANIDPLREAITVTPARGELRLQDTASSVVLIDSRSVERAPSRSIDDLLRQIPGFSLLRRTSSLVANPTTQGVSLRGLGTNGASRTLVLLDGQPINDPFGGWVYWQRIGRTAIDRIEVVSGSNSDLYGNTALSGVIQVVERKPQPALALDIDFGNRDTRSLSLFAAHRWRRVALAFSGDLLDTDGYFIISRRARGRVDEPARSQHASAQIKTVIDISNELKATLRAASFSEDRDNGTRLQDNHTEIRSFGAAFNYLAADRTSVIINAYGSTQSFTSTFSAIALNRQQEFLTRSQRVPADSYGFSAQWSRPFNGHTLLAGFELRNVDGINNEVIFQNGLPAGLAVNGGRQRNIGLFLQDSIALKNNLRLSLGAQINNSNNRERKARTSKSETEFNPKVALLYRPQDSIGLRAAIYRAFRAPTLNELYRPFRVGNVVTLANADLSAETLTGGEAGIDYTPIRSLLISMTVFSVELSGPVGNITLQARPDLITRQRQNIGAIRSTGVETRAQYIVNENFNVTAGYLYTSSKIESFSVNSSLVGNRVPQVPEHQASFSAAYTFKRAGTFVIQARASSTQFEDDQNRLSLAGFGLVDLAYRRRLGSHLEVFVNVENVADKRVITGRTQVDTIGAPRLVSGGIRLRFGNK